MNHKSPGFMLLELLVALCCGMLIIVHWYRFMSSLRAGQVATQQGYQAMVLMREYVEQIYASGRLEPTWTVGIFSLSSHAHSPSFIQSGGGKNNFKTIDLTASWENNGKKQTYTFVTGAIIHHE